MNVQVVAVGKIKDKFVDLGLKEYSKRMGRYGRFQIVEVKEDSFNEPLSEKEIEQILAREGERVLAAIKPRSFVFALDRAGESWSSEELAAEFQRLAISGTSQLVFVIGGSLGLDERVTDSADVALSFSAFTFPHQLMRLILLEQIYRAWRALSQIRKGGRLMRWNKISDAVIRRLPLYLRVLDDLANESETESISSQELGVRAGVGPALVRKDLAWFGEFGKQGVGYEIGFLRDELRKILNLDSNLPVGLVGVGSLGVALTRYHLKRFAEDESFNLELAVLFDSDVAKIGGSVEGIPVHGLEDIPSQVQEKGLKIVIITVPAQNAQDVANQFIHAGIQGILNFAPVKLQAPDTVHVVNTDVSLELQRLAYYVPKTTKS